MAKHEVVLDKRKYVMFSKVTKSQRNNGSPLNIRVQFSMNGTPWTKGGQPRNGETARDATFRYFDELRTYILGERGSKGIATQAGWPYGDIKIVFDDFHTVLKSQPVEV